MKQNPNQNLNIAPKIKSVTISNFGYKRFFAVLLAMVVIASPLYTLLLYEHKAAATHDEVSFAATVNYPVGDAPSSDLTSGPIAVELNNDGNIDLAIAASGDDQVSVLISNGDGTFDPAASYPVGMFPFSAASGDFNEDGFADLVATNFDTNISVLINNGDGTFAATVNYSMSDSPYGRPYINDFNKDGNLDVAVAGNQVGLIAVFMGNGDGTFDPVVEYANDMAIEMVVADFNNDTWLDIATSNNASDNISVFINDGDGTFAAAVNYPAGTNPYLGIVSGDFNDDDFADIVVGNQGSDNISVFINDGDGTFATAVNYAAGDRPTGVSVVDLDNDSALDIVTVNSFSDNVSVLMGVGDGTFAAEVNYAAGNEAFGIALADSLSDFNNDGNIDLVIPNYSDGNLTVLLGVGDGTFIDGGDFTVQTQPSGVVVGEDFNEDGLPDIAVANNGSDSISVLINNTSLPEVSFTSSAGSGNEAVTSPPLEVELSGSSDIDVTVDYAVTGGTATGGGLDYTLASGTLTIPDPMISGVIPLAIVDDGTLEADETVIITLTDPTNAVLVSPVTFTYTIINDDSSSGGGSSSGSKVHPRGDTGTTPGLQYPGSPTHNPINPKSPSGAPLIAPVEQFARNLGYGKIGEDVKRLQQFLNMNEFDLAPSSYGSPGNETTFFGPRTFRAVKAFQEAFAPQILGPLGLTQGTGYFGIYTRTFVNNLLK